MRRAAAPATAWGVAAESGDSAQLPRRPSYCSRNATVMM